MPLVLLVGHPASGKTTRAKELATYLHQKLFSTESPQSPEPQEQQEIPSESKQGNKDSNNFNKQKQKSSPAKSSLPSSRICEIILVNHESLNLSRALMYSSASNERAGQSSIRAAVDRYLTSSRIIIVDYLNNVKGFRYELHCRAREMGSTYCVIYLDITPEQCRQNNEQRRTKAAEHHQRTDEEIEEAYEESVMNDLLQRMEVPNGSKRWDSPLFSISSMSDPLPLADISQWLLYGQSKTPGLATLNNQLDDTTYMTDLDQTISTICNNIVQQQHSNLHNIGDCLSIPYTDTRLILTRSIHLAELKRIQSQFIKMAKLRPIHGQQAIATSFINHLQNVLNL